MLIRRGREESSKGEGKHERMEGRENRTTSILLEGFLTDGPLPQIRWHSWERGVIR